MVKMPAPDLASDIAPAERTAAAESIILICRHRDGRGRERADQIDGRSVRAGVVKRDGVARAEADEVYPVQPVGAGGVPIIDRAVAMPGQILRRAGRHDEHADGVGHRRAVIAVDVKIEAAEAGEISRGGEFRRVTVRQQVRPSRSSGAITE